MILLLLGYSKIIVAWYR